MTRPVEQGVIAVRGRPAIGPGCAPYVIAEIGTNHDRDIAIARDMIRAIALAGCDCAKFQIYEPEEIVSARVRAADYGLDAVYGDISAQEMFARHLQTPKAWFPELLDLCHAEGLDCAATIHGPHGLDWAMRTGIDLIKIASMDHTNLPLFAEIRARASQPVLISFGMGALEDIDAAVAALRDHGAGVGLFHCVAVYPPEPEEIRIGNIPFMQARYGLPIGFSDHTLDSTVALLALAAGANFFEKHVTMDRARKGPDHPFAMEFAELAAYVAALRDGRRALSPPDTFLPPSPRETRNRDAYLKSIVARRDLAAGESLGPDDVYLARPGTGLPPGRLPAVLGMRLRRDVAAETPLHAEDLDEGGEGA